MHHDLLFEIGVEELPSSFVASALQALPALATKRFKELRLGHRPPRVFGTPRRLTLVVEELADRQTDVSEELTGPPSDWSPDEYEQWLNERLREVLLADDVSPDRPR